MTDSKCFIDRVSYVAIRNNVYARFTNVLEMASDFIIKCNGKFPISFIFGNLQCMENRHFIQTNEFSHFAMEKLFQCSRYNLFVSEFLEI